MPRHCSIVSPAARQSAETYALEEAALRAYRVELFERRRVPRNEAALAAAIEARRVAEHAANNRALFLAA